MFELPELTVLSRQMNETFPGKGIREGSLGNSPHKFVWYNRTREEFAQLVAGKRPGEAGVRGRWLFLPLEPGYVFVLGECGGRAVYHPQGEDLPEKHHLYLGFDDGSSFTVTTQMWGAMELYAQGEELHREYIRNMRPYPGGPGFHFEYFQSLVAECVRGEKRSVKGLLTQDQLIPGLGNAIAQDILFAAGLHPRHPVSDLDDGQVRSLYDAVVDTVDQVTARGGRNDEVDLFGRPGGYVRLMDKNSAGRPCPRCGTPVEKIQYLGGACYFCPSCQV